MSWPLGGCTRTREAKVPIMQLGAGVARLANSVPGLSTVADGLMAGAAETNTATTRRPVLVRTIRDASLGKPHCS